MNASPASSLVAWLLTKRSPFQTYDYCSHLPGERLLAFLCSRPVTVRHEGKPERRSILGRETALAPVEWTSDGWLRLRSGGNLPPAEIPLPNLPPHPFPAAPETEIFDQPTLSSAWQTIRAHQDASWLTLTERPGHLRLHGRESLGSLFDVSLVARRVEHRSLHVETTLDFQPDTPWQMAGLTAFYGSENYYFLAVSRNDDGRRCLVLFRRDNRQEDQLLPDEGLPLGETGRLTLSARLDGDRLQFFYAEQPDPAPKPAGPAQDAGMLSDEHANLRIGSFTGAFISLATLDLSGMKKHADFRSFTCRPQKT